ncbi:MAG: porin [Polaromonas sp.]
MKKHLFAVAAAAALATPAMAQSTSASSVTLYGIADIALISVSNKDGSRLNALDSGILQSSRFGFRGNEDLGGGLSALFVLESGFNLDTGASSSAASFFNRQSFIGLSSQSMGTLALGRQYGPIYDQLIGLSGAPAFGVQAGAIDGIANGKSSAARFENTIGSTRFDNSVKYTSPTMSGFKASAMVGLGEVAGSTSSGQTLSAGVGYNQGPVNLGLGYLTTKCKATTGCAATEDDNKVIGLGGGYDFGVAKLSAIYTSQKNGKNVRGNDADVLSLIAQMPLGAWTLAAGYQTLNDKTKLDQNIKQVNLGALYSLSKRTTAYALYSTQKVDNGGKASMALYTSSNDKQNIIGLGIRHTF